MQSTSKEKANTLLQIIGVGQRLAELELKEKEIYNKRHAIGQIKDQKTKFAKEQPFYPEAPKEPVSASELILQQQSILAKNGENARKRQNVSTIEQQYRFVTQEVERLTKLLDEAKQKEDQLFKDLSVAQTDAQDLIDESTEELERSIEQVDEINRKVRANYDKDKAEQDAAEYDRQYNELTHDIENVRKEKAGLLDNTDLPLPGLSVENGELLYLGQRWDNMSGSQQLIVSVSIVRKLKPDCGFVLMDKLEQMDQPTLKEFGAWLEQEGLQVIATRVSTGEECSIIIEDGYALGQEEQIEENNTTAPFSWQG